MYRKVQVVSRDEFPIKSNISGDGIINRCYQIHSGHEIEADQLLSFSWSLSLA